ncbi:hypothetical protein L1077_20465 [Pseudoalteromonas luteoviolacea]|uniref:hypothetical protein n=1 Tax=Pseudoalteromonas luteoviolacea TaxID=43657 RepID=UPI001F195D87|nr:hypothetical protein [Pseudoalteromonas luteoviolacea]MCF6441814.1 hypothetical protein [Pseudoalteromonas luteoviolacea]
MKLKLNKKSVKTLSENKALMAGMTPQVAGGNQLASRLTSPWGGDCWTGNDYSCPAATCEQP